MADSPLGLWVKRAGVTLVDVHKTAKVRYATVWDVAHGHTPRADTAHRIARGSEKLVRERKLEIRPITAAEILGVAA
jgi:predicted transcriptional regulator